MRGRDYAIDLCGTLDVLKPAVMLMVRCQAVNLPSWKIVGWFPEKIQESLTGVLNEEQPHKDLLPKLSKHWEDLFHAEAEDCHFQGQPLLEGWLVVGEEKAKKTSASGKETIQTTYTWDARTPYECIEDLLVLCEEIGAGLQRRFNDIVPVELSNLFEAFDIEENICSLTCFRFDHGTVLVDLDDRISWETKGMTEFSSFFHHVCSLPHIKEHVTNNVDSNLVDHNAQLVSNQLKSPLKKIVWENLGGVAEKMFLTKDGEFVKEFNCSQLARISLVEKHSLNKWFLLEFVSGQSVAAYVDEAYVISTFYCNAEIIQPLGQDACIVIDVAMASSGCEAIVEGFYSVIKAHTKSGGQSNKVLMERAVVDWALPHPIACPSTIAEISELYTSGNKKRGVRKHRSAIFMDVRERAAVKYRISKVLDRHAAEAPKCPFLLSSKQLST